MRRHFTRKTCINQKVFTEFQQKLLTSRCFYGILVKAFDKTKVFAVYTEKITKETDSKVYICYR